MRLSRRDAPRGEPQRARVRVRVHQRLCGRAHGVCFSLFGVVVVVVVVVVAAVVVVAVVVARMK